MHLTRYHIATDGECRRSKELRDRGLGLALGVCAYMWLIAAATQSVAQSPPGDSTDAVVHAAQNPVASVISVPFQNNTYFNLGPYHRSADVLLVQPVIPFKLNDDWNLITRWITPVVIDRPRISPSEGQEFGLGNLEPQFYLSPAHPGKIIWGVGPQVVVPTATDKTFGVRRWGGGPAAVALTIQGPWVGGLLANNAWTGRENGRRFNEMTLNPFVNYNLPHGWYLASSPVITADWEAESSNRWTVPVGGGFGRVFKIGEQRVNARIQGLYNVVRPDYAPDWQLQVQVQFLFPTK